MFPSNQDPALAYSNSKWNRVLPKFLSRLYTRLVMPAAQTICKSPIGSIGVLSTVCVVVFAVLFSISDLQLALRGARTTLAVEGIQMHPVWLIVLTTLTTWMIAFLTFTANARAERSNTQRLAMMCLVIVYVLGYLLLATKLTMFSLVTMSSTIAALSHIFLPISFFSYGAAHVGKISKTGEKTVAWALVVSLAASIFISIALPYVRGAFPIPKSHVFSSILTADLQNVDFTKLPDPHFEDTWMNNANLQSSNLNALRITPRDLSWTSFQHASLQGTRFDARTFQGVDFSHADLTNVSLLGANLVDTKLTGANLTGARLRETSFQNVDVTGAILHRVILDSANLSDTDLSTATLSQVAFRSNDLSEVTLRDTGIRNSFGDATSCVARRVWSQ